MTTWQAVFWSSVAGASGGLIGAMAAWWIDNVPLLWINGFLAGYHLVVLAAFAAARRLRINSR